MALKLIQGMDDISMTSVKLDNQAAILALGGLWAKPARALLDTVHNVCDKWEHRGRWQGIQVSFNWVSGHDGIWGNEQVDIEAKTAISEGSSPWASLPDELQVDELPHSLTALVGSFKKELRIWWKGIWVKSPRRARLAKIDAKLPSHACLKLTNQLTRAQASVLMQLHTGHIPLNHFLNQIGKINSPDCPTCPGMSETIHHFIFKFPAHAHADTVWQEQQDATRNLCDIF